jgi:hypothetical protein
MELQLNAVVRVHGGKPASLHRTKTGSMRSEEGHAEMMLVHVFLRFAVGAMRKRLERLPLEKSLLLNKLNKFTSHGAPEHFTCIPSEHSSSCPTSSADGIEQILSCAMAATASSVQAGRQ